MSRLDQRWLLRNNVRQSKSERIVELERREKYWIQQDVSKIQEGIDGGGSIRMGRNNRHRDTESTEHRRMELSHFLFDSVC